MNLSSLVIPVLLAGVALYGMGKRVDVYGALTHGDSKVGTLSVHSSICTSTSPRSSAVWMIGVEPLIILGVML